MPENFKRPRRIWRMGYQHTPQEAVQLIFDEAMIEYSPCDLDVALEIINDQRYWAIRFALDAVKNIDALAGDDDAYQFKIKAIKAIEALLDNTGWTIPGMNHQPNVAESNANVACNIKPIEIEITEGPKPWSECSGPDCKACNHEPE